ncbi:MAG: hypothetical protein R3B13_05450 [Polyangiaceae bacterium]
MLRVRSAVSPGPCKSAHAARHGVQCFLVRDGHVVDGEVVRLVAVSRGLSRKGIPFGLANWMQGPAAPAGRV